MIVAFLEQSARIRNLRMIMFDFRTEGSRLKKTKLNLGDTVGFLNMEEMDRFTKRMFIKMLSFVCAVT